MQPHIKRWWVSSGFAAPICKVSIHAISTRVYRIIPVFVAEVTNPGRMIEQQSFLIQWYWVGGANTRRIETNTEISWRYRQQPRPPILKRYSHWICPAFSLCLGSRCAISSLPNELVIENFDLSKFCDSTAKEQRSKNCLTTRLRLICDGRTRISKGSWSSGITQANLSQLVNE